MFATEPTVTLPSGVVVSAAIDSLVRHLVQTGHTVSVDDGTVLVTPAVHADSQFQLEANWSDVQALVATEAPCHPNNDGQPIQLPEGRTRSDTSSFQAPDDVAVDISTTGPESSVDSELLTIDDVLAMIEARSRDAARKLSTELLLIEVDPDDIDSVIADCDARAAAAVLELRPWLATFFADVARRAPR